MPLPTTLKLFIDVKAGLAYPTFSSTSPISNPSFFLGDLAKLQLFFVEQTGLGSYPRQEVAGLGTPGIRVAVGQIDASPTSGHFTLTFGANTTNVMDYNTTASFMETKLNQLASISAAGGVTVSKVGDNYAIKFVSNGSRGAITGDASALVPLCTVGISVLQEGDATHPEIVLVHLQQNVAALATSFTALPASTASISTLSAWDGSRAVYRLAISPDPKGGTFSLAYDALTGTDVSTASIAVGSTALDVQNALSINALEDKVTVQQVGAYAYDIAVTAEPDTAGLTVDDAGLLSFAGFEGDLDINTANAISYLDGADFLETTLEVEISDGAAHQTVLQIPCTLKSAVIDEAAVNTVTLDPVLTQATGDGRYLRQANNLSDLASTSTARTNLDVYSKAEVDAAVAGGGGGGGLADAPNDGKGYARQSAAWTSSPTFDAVTLGASGVITFPDATTQSTAAVAFNGGTVGSSISVTGSGGTVTLSDTGLDLSASTGGGAITVGTSGITFSDSSVQTTAAVAGANVADCLAHTVYNVYWTGGSWSMTFQPINHHLNNLMAGGNLQIYSASGTDNITGLSQTSQVTFSTTSATSTDAIYVRMIINGVTITSTQPLNYP